MLWKDGKMDERTTLAARPPQYAWMPNLELVSEAQLGHRLAYVRSPFM
jgi:hypothetical protein